MNNIPEIQKQFERERAVEVFTDLFLRKRGMDPARHPMISRSIQEALLALDKAREEQLEADIPIVI